MIVSVHQPHFLPWLGYFNKALSSDVFVLLHTVQYRKNYYQNRTRIRNVDGRPLWLTLPVHAHLGTPIDEVRIAEPRWRERVAKTVEQCYHKAPFLPSVWPPLQEALAGSEDRLDAVNEAAFRSVLGLLGGPALRVVRSGELAAVSPDPTQRLVEICRELGATRYLAGRGGRRYMRVEDFERAGIEVVWQEYDAAAVTYPQGGGEFLGGLSILDALVHVGPAATRELALSGSKAGS
ncbi:MAG: WbqC family protein [Thermoanaerobaculia bacterium]